MFLMKKLLSLAAFAAAILGQSIAVHAADISFSVGQTGESTMTYRLGLQSNWDTSWWQSSTGRVTGYWDGAYTYWEGDSTPDDQSLSFSPVFVYEFAGDSIKPYLEAGIGVAAFSNTKIESNDLGAVFQFEDRVGFGLRFGAGQEVGFRVLHYSNAGMQHHNDGVESYALHYRMAL
jgi:lipid A 3-O-deacylase